MKENKEESYREYLKKQLDLIFNMQAYRKKSIINRPAGLKENQVYDKKRRIHEVRSIGEFVNGHAIVEIVETHDINNILDQEIVEQLADAILMGKKLPPIPNRRYNFIDENYVLTFDHSEGPEKDSKYWFKSVRDFHHGVAVATDAQGNKRYVNENGKFLVLGNTKDELCDFFGKCGLAITGDIIYLLSADDKIVGNGGVAEGSKITNYHRNRFSQQVNMAVTKPNKGISIVTCININRSFITLIEKTYKPRVKKSVKYSGKAFNVATDLQDYKVEGKRSGYELNNGKNKYVVRYLPIKVFDGRFTLCMHKSQLYLYDKVLNEYSIIGDPLNTFYDDHLIVNYRGNMVVRAMLIYEGKFMDITEYYRDNLADIEEFKVTSGIKLLSEYEYNDKHRTQVERERSIRELIKENENIVRELEKNVSIEYGGDGFEGLFLSIDDRGSKGKH